MAGVATAERRAFSSAMAPLFTNVDARPERRTTSVPTMKTILVIEDEVETLKNLVLMLEMEGFKAFSAAHGRIGIEVARRELPDVIVCDISMPELDGYGVLEALRADEATGSIPFIFLSAKGDKKDLRRGMNLGADDYLTKPAGAEEVLAAIHSRLERRHRNERATLQRAEVRPDFSSAVPLVALGLTPREAEVLLWVAQGKSNSEIATVLGCAENTVKVHLARVFEKLGVENRNAASLLALDVLSRVVARASGPDSKPGERGRA